ncbi:MAG: hypothetical protein RLZZ283_520 [Candidatus Parcubacteria bacterium]|jgi:uncharacterized membrane protein SpoIIM required for sporulation
MNEGFIEKNKLPLALGAIFLGLLFGLSGPGIILVGGGLIGLAEYFAVLAKKKFTEYRTRGHGSYSRSPAVAY